LSLLESELHSGAVDARELGPLFKHVAIVVEILDAQEHVSLLDLPAEVCRAALLLQPYLWCRPWKIRQGGCQLRDAHALHSPHALTGTADAGCRARALSSAGSAHIEAARRVLDQDQAAPAETQDVDLLVILVRLPAPHEGLQTHAGAHAAAFPRCGAVRWWCGAGTRPERSARQTEGRGSVRRRGVRLRTSIP